MVHDATWRTDDDMCLLLQLFTLFRERFFPVDGSRFDSFETSDVRHVFPYLNGEFACRRQDEHLWFVFGPVDELDDRNSESSCLSASGLCFDD